MAQNFISGAQLNTSTGIFLSGPQTGTGSAQSIAHGLQRVPTNVVAIWQGTGTWTVSYGAKDANNVTVTAANTSTYLVMAW